MITSVITIIAGSRTFNDYELLKRKCDALLRNKIDNGDKIIIVSGGANGADKLGERYATERGFELMVFKSDWEKLGKSAGHVRNSKMAEFADFLIAFHDGESRGTAHMIDVAKSMKKAIRVIKF